MTNVLNTCDVRRVTPGVSQLIFFPQGRSLVGLSPAKPGESKAYSADSPGRWWKRKTAGTTTIIV